MNRDEARTRGAEQPPEVYETASGMPWAAPTDSEKGGTWMAINGRGLAGCLLNRYQDVVAMAPESAESRGWILPRLMAFPCLDDASDALQGGAIDPTRFPPFTLLLASPAGARRFDWRGDSAFTMCDLGPSWQFISSSFFEPETVLPWRQQAFDDWRDKGAALHQGIPAIHLYSPPGQESMAPMMSRDISCTRSITQASFGEGGHGARLRYAPVTKGALAWPALSEVIALPAASDSC